MAAEANTQRLWHRLAKAGWTGEILLSFVIILQAICPNGRTFARKPTSNLRLKEWPP